MTGTATGTAMPTFDITAPLPRVGVSALEASAGTGKTWAVATLAARYVAEGTRLDQLLVITFSRAATQELRDRVRFRLTEAVKALEDPYAATDQVLVDVLTHDATGAPLPEEECATRRHRLQSAVTQYDAATILTTHGFCDLVLRSLGVAGQTDVTDRLVEDVDDLVEDVVVDEYLRRWADSPEEPPVEVGDARAAARAAVHHLRGRIEPDASVDPRAGALVAFARAVVAEVDARKRSGGLLTFDDLLTRLADAVEGDDSPAAQRMRERWPVVLVDEFQDTDDVQWRVLEAAFAQHSRLVLIGDPKQAIYAFRGGDTPTYLRAVRGATKQTLAVNWRSDPAVVEALQVLTRGAALGDEGIVVHPVSAHRTTSRLAGVTAGVRLRHLHRAGHPLNGNGTLKAPAAPQQIALDVADDLARLLSSGATYDGRPLRAGDVAILLPSVRYDGSRILTALRDKRIPFVVNTAETVMGGPAAQHWTTLLLALEQPQRPGRVRAAALTPFLGVTPEELDAGGDDLVDHLAERVRGWLDLVRSRGVAAVVAAAHAAGMARRVLTQAGGERLLTDLDHIGELLHEAAVDRHLGVTGLLRWLDEAIEEGGRSDARRRRLDIDADAVQVLTVHGAKGLEFPVVYLPQLYERRVNDRETIHAYHDGDDRCLDVAGTPAAARAARRETAQEDLRLAYVALTRATSLVVAWWAPTWNAGNGGLSRLLFGREDGRAEVSQQVEVPADDANAEVVLQRWADRGAFSLERAQPTGEPPLRLAPPRERLACRSFERTLDTEWRRTSYSGLIRAEEQLITAASEPEDVGTVDEELPPIDGAAVPVLPQPAAEGPVSPMADMPAGATFGSLVHAVLEHADPSAPDLLAELRGHVEEQRRWWTVDAASEDVAAALLPLHDTPLGPLAEDLTLRRIGRADRLCELDFEFPMAGGDAAGPTDLPLAAFATALRRHLPAGDPLRGYADRLEAPGLGEQRLRGYLSGSIDVVLRVPDASAPGGARFVVVDYKTNQLGEPGRPSTAWDYRAEAVAAAMVHSHYPLQALLYTVVLHRYLRWRLGAAYEPERHLGGVLYLYLRGMCGPATPAVDGVPCGVFSWRPPVALVEELSQLLAGEEAPR
ncbi:UvrD-helicase domain-containing protein [Nocardioides terrisoli]|uniref:UvrD-helicase domain-containing protein n=1 Tax=Nocardioides terrisoli TaxID=3388267 RepID=UPI00287BC875|nr:UvrD-helicase domain-containing protein [Nocardioides marmorisolisilvae]